MTRIKANRELTDTENEVIDYLVRRGFSVTLNKCTSSFAIFLAERNGLTKAFRVRTVEEYKEVANRIAEFVLKFSLRKGENHE